MAAKSVTINVSFEEPGLLESFFEERFTEMEESMARCGLCARFPGNYCEWHTAMAQELTDDISALAIGMMRLTVKDHHG